MAEIKTRQRPLVAQIVAVLRISNAAGSGIDPVGCVVKRLRPCVRAEEIERAQSLLERRLQCIVVGVCRRLEIVDERKLRKLRVEGTPLLPRSRRTCTGLIDIAYAIELPSSGTHIGRLQY